MPTTLGPEKKNLGINEGFETKELYQIMGYELKLIYITYIAPKNMGGS